MFLGSDPCPQSNGRDLLTCAAQEMDHTECCKARGVALTSAGDKCLGFCQMSPGSQFQVNLTFTFTVENVTVGGFELNVVAQPVYLYDNGLSLIRL